MQWNRGYKPAHLWEGPGLTPGRNHRKQLRAKFRQGNDDNYLRHARFCKRRKEAGFTESQAEVLATELAKMLGAPCRAAKVVDIRSDENPQKLKAISWFIRVLRRYQFKCELEGRESTRASALSRWAALPPEIAAEYREMLAPFICTLTRAFTPVAHIEPAVEEATKRFGDNPWERMWERALARATILDGIELDRSFQQALAAGQLHQNYRKDKASSRKLAKEKWRAQPDTPIHEMIDTLQDILKLETGRDYAEGVIPRLFHLRVNWAGER